MLALVMIVIMMMMMITLMGALKIESKQPAIYTLSCCIELISELLILLPSTLVCHYIQMIYTMKIK